MYIDENGELAWFVLPMIIGGLAGMYGGGAMANGSANPTDWDFSSGKTWGYMLGGAAIGAGSGVLGAYVAGGTTMVPSIVPSIQMEASYGLGLGTTAGMASASTASSIGMSALSGWESDITTNLGFATVNWSDLSKSKINNPFDDESMLQNFSDAMGWLGNFQDMHYARNNLNDLPSAQEILSDEEWKMLSHDKCVYHIGEGNELKFINGRQEAVIGIGKYGKPYIVTDPNLMGTYNIVPPGGLLNNVGHALLDVVPYYLYGNTRADFLSTFRFTQYNRWKDGLHYY